MDNVTFSPLYPTLMKNDFMKTAVSAFGKRPALPSVLKLVSGGGAVQPRIRTPANHPTAAPNPPEATGKKGVFPRKDKSWVVAVMPWGETAKGQSQSKTKEERVNHAYGNTCVMLHDSGAWGVCRMPHNTAVIP